MIKKFRLVDTPSGILNILKENLHAVNQDLSNTVTEYVIGSDFPGTPVDQLVSVINDTGDFIVEESEIVIFNVQLNASTLRHKFVFKLGVGSWGAGATLVTAADFVSLDDNLGPVAFSNDYNDLDNKPAGKSVQNRYADMATMFADQANQNDALLQYVLDASGDATVDLGYAYYEYLGTTVGDITDYVKLSEEESMDVIEKTKTSEFTNDGEDGLNAYLDELKPDIIIGGLGWGVTETSLAAYFSLTASDLKITELQGSYVRVWIKKASTTINQNAFVGNTDITYFLDLTGKISAIYNSAFDGATNLTKVSFPNVSQIWLAAFQGTGLTPSTIEAENVGDLKASVYYGLSDIGYTMNFRKLKTVAQNSFSALTSNLNLLVIESITASQVFDSHVGNIYLPMLVSLGDPTTNQDVFLGKTNGIIVVPPIFKTNNVGGLDATLQAAELQGCKISFSNHVSQFVNDGSDGTSAYAEIDEVNLLKTPTDIRVIPNSVLPSTTQDVVVECKDMTSDSTVSFGTGVTINSQSVELNSFGSFIVRANVTLDATEQAIDVTVDNGLSGTATDILNVVNGTVSFPIASDWTELSVSAPDVSQTGEVISTALNTNNTAVWDGVVDETLDFVIKFNIRISALGLQENSDRHNFFAIKQSGGTNIATLQYQVEGFGLLNTYTEALGGTLGQHKENVVGITSYQEAWEWLRDNVVPEFRWNATTQELTYWRRNALIRTFPSGIDAGTKLWFDAKYLDLVNIQYIDLSTANAGDPYNDNYLKPGDKTSLLENDGADGLNPYLDATNSPYNTVIKGVASVYTSKYSLKNLFRTDAAVWTDADADKYIKNYYVDIPNDTITFYITRQYYLTNFAFNNASQGNAITHYLDWGGYVTVPGNQAFRYNTNIQEIVFPKATGDSTFCFEGNSALTKLHVPCLDLVWVQGAGLLTDVDFSKAKSLFNIKNIGAVGEIYAPEATDVGFNQANGVTSWYLPRATYLTGNMYNNSPLTNLYAPNCVTYRAQLRNANAITTLLLPNVTDASGLPARAFEADSLTTIYMPKAKSFGREAVVEGMFDGSTIGAGCTLTVNEFLRTSNGGAMNVNVQNAINKGIKVVFAKDDAPALDNRIVDLAVTTTYNFDLSRASDWKLTMTGDTTFTESNLPTLDRTLEYTFKLTGAFVPTFPTYWTVVGDTYNGSVSNFFSVQVHDGNSGSEEVTVFISNLA